MGQNHRGRLLSRVLPAAMRVRAPFASEDVSIIISSKRRDNETIRSMYASGILCTRAAKCSRMHRTPSYFTPINFAD